MTVSPNLVELQTQADDATLILFMQECGGRLLSAWRTLEARMSGDIVFDRLDVVLAHYAYGLTQPLYGEQPAQRQLDAVVSLLAKVLSDERVDAAIHAAEGFDKRFAGTCENLVRLGERDANVIIQSIHSNSQGPLGSLRSLAHDAPEGVSDVGGAYK